MSNRYKLKKGDRIEFKKDSGYTGTIIETNGKNVLVQLDGIKPCIWYDGADLTKLNKNGG